MSENIDDVLLTKILENKFKLNITTNFTKKEFEKILDDHLQKIICELGSILYSIKKKELEAQERLEKLEKLEKLNKNPDWYQGNFWAFWDKK
jgi:SMC interacting uncharacterized protein involved in chromosome segregation